LRAKQREESAFLSMKGGYPTLKSRFIRFKAGFLEWREPISEKRSAISGSYRWPSAAPTAASRTRLWLLSGWGCQGQRLSRGRGNPDMPCGLSACRPKEHMRGPNPNAPTQRQDRLEPHRGGRRSSGIPRPPRSLDPTSEKLPLECKRATGPVRVRTGSRCQCLDRFGSVASFESSGPMDHRQVLRLHERILGEALSQIIR